MKLFKVINNPQDKLFLQLDLNNIDKWSSTNEILLNIKKCFTISFGQSIHSFFYYYLSNIYLKSVNYIEDLGIIFDSKLTFNFHSDHIRNLAIKKINFIKRFTKNLKSLNTFCTFYFSYLYPIFYYCSIIWDPYLKYQSTAPKKANHKYLRCTAYKLGLSMRYEDHNYSQI